MNISFAVNIRCDEYDVLVARGTKWGNPYSHKANSSAKYIVGSKREAIKAYCWYLIEERGDLISLAKAELPRYG